MTWGAGPSLCYSPHLLRRLEVLIPVRRALRASPYRDLEGRCARRQSRHLGRNISIPTSTALNQSEYPSELPKTVTLSLFILDLARAMILVYLSRLV